MQGTTEYFLSQYLNITKAYNDYYVYDDDAQSYKVVYLYILVLVKSSNPSKCDMSGYCKAYTNISEM